MVILALLAVALLPAAVVLVALLSSLLLLPLTLGLPLQTTRRNAQRNRSPKNLGPPGMVLVVGQPVPMPVLGCARCVVCDVGV